MPDAGPLVMDASTAKKPLSQAEMEVNFAVYSAIIGIKPINRGRRRKGTDRNDSLKYDR